MRLSHLIREYVDLKIEGEPSRREWSSIDSERSRRDEYHNTLAGLEADIDQAFASLKGSAA